MLNVYEQITIKTLAKQGQKKTRIARELGCHRNTVHNILNRERVVLQQTRSKASVFDPYREQIKQFLGDGVTVSESGRF